MTSSLGASRAPAVAQASGAAIRPLRWSVTPTPARPACPFAGIKTHVARNSRLCLAAASSSSTQEPAAAPGADVEEPLAVLRRAASTKAVPPDDVIAAIKAVEAAHKARLAQGASDLVQGFPEALNGRWRLVFSAPSAIKAWQYIPVLEDVEIDLAAGRLDILSLDVFGLFDSRFEGSCEAKTGTAEGQYDLLFGFHGTEFKWFKRWETRGELKYKEKVYSFFLLADDIAVANSSSGYQTLMLRVG